jgi:hypothetical protein
VNRRVRRARPARRLDDVQPVRLARVRVRVVRDAGDVEHRIVLAAARGVVGSPLDYLEAARAGLRRDGRSDEATGAHDHDAHDPLHRAPLFAAATPRPIGGNEKASRRDAARL